MKAGSKPVFMLHRKKLGQWGESKAQEYYQVRGWRLLVRNYFSRWGEIDLAMTKDDRLLIVEVKTRQDHSYGWPEETISTAKIERLYQTASKLINELSWQYNVEIELFCLELGDNKAKIRRFKIQDSNID